MPLRLRENTTVSQYRRGRFDEMLSANLDGQILYAKIYLLIFKDTVSTVLLISKR